MAKLQNKLFAKLEVVEEKGEIILDNLKVCQQLLAMIVSQCEELLQAFAKDPEQLFLGLGRTFDHVSNVLVLTIARVGAVGPRTPGEIDPGDVGDKDEDDIIMKEMKNKLREVLRLADTLQAFCLLTLEDTKKRIDFASKIRVEPHHDFMVLGNISPLLSLSETLLTEVAVTVLMVLNNLVNLNNSHPDLRAKIMEIIGSESSSAKSNNAVAKSGKTRGEKNV